VASALARKLAGWLPGLLHAGAALFRDLSLARAMAVCRQLLRRLTGSMSWSSMTGSWPRCRTERRDSGDRRGSYQTRSIILDFAAASVSLAQQIGDPTLADGILDRLVHNAHRIEMRGDSIRKQKGVKEEKVNESASPKAVERRAKSAHWKSLRDFHFSHSLNNNKA